MAEEANNTIQDQLHYQILLADRLVNAAQDADSSKSFCSELAKQAAQLSQFLHSIVPIAASTPSQLYDRPVRRISAEASENLERALTLVRKCNHSGNVLRQVFSITSSKDFLKISVLLESSIADIKWLLSILDSSKPEPIYQISLPPIASNDPILAFVWSNIASLQMSQRLEDRIEAADALASLARDNDRYKKIIVEEDGTAPLLKLLKDGANSPEAQIAAATALHYLATDQRRVKVMASLFAVPIIVQALDDSPIKVQVILLNLVSRMSEFDSGVREDFRREHLTRPLVTLQSMDDVLDDPNPNSETLALACPQRAKPALRQFSLAELTEATNNFDEELIITRGRFHKVYEGTYLDYVGRKKTRKTVAVKSLSVLLVEWEIPLWSQFCHYNIVSLLGYCHDSDGPIFLVYEYMPNGSLANHLCAKSTSSSFSLSWEKCIQICIDAARGLEYMHSTSFKFFHGDLTVSNILLDNNGVGKISDLESNIYNEKGVASFWDPEFSHDHIHTNITIAGYRSDVYTFGVLLVTVLSRKVSFDEEDKNLGIWLHQCITKGTINQMIHPDMKAQIPSDRLKAFVDIAGECLDPCGEKRPTVTKLVEKLEFAMGSSSQRLCHRYSFLEIEEATNNFENILGEGGEGKVFGGEIQTNIPVAVKLLKPERSSEFENEIKILSTLDHPNLVSLVGYCHESDQKVLVYEQMCNGNLQTALRAVPLSWEQRLNICIGAARGLRHLHTGTKESPKGIIHRDMKPSNILLDQNFNAKISDFGLSKMSIHDQATSEITTTFKGTIGYYAPEYLWKNKITRRIDVYAFGVILTEVLCGKKPWDRDNTFFLTDPNEKYSQWAKENVDLLDPHMEGAISPSCLEAFTDILEKCLNVNPDARPSMNDVVSVLENAQKWQETWQRNDSGLLFYLPGGEDRVALYYSTSNSEEATGSTFQDCLRVRLFLRRFGVPIDERDPTKDLYAKEFKQVFGTMEDLRLPKVFVRGKFVGGIEILYKTRELAKLLRVPPPRFVCRSCGEARSCDVCKREEWFLLCRNCDALTTKVSQGWKRGMICCLQCNGNQLIYKSNLETQ